MTNANSNLMETLEGREFFSMTAMPLSFVPPPNNPTTSKIEQPVLNGTTLDDKPVKPQSDRQKATTNPTSS